jgi:hypothetical protein
MPVDVKHLFTDAFTDSASPASSSNSIVSVPSYIESVDYSVASSDGDAHTRGAIDFVDLSVTSSSSPAAATNTTSDQPQQPQQHHHHHHHQQQLQQQNSRGHLLVALSNNSNNGSGGLPTTDEQRAGTRHSNASLASLLRPFLSCLENESAAMAPILLGNERAVHRLRVVLLALWASRAHAARSPLESYAMRSRSRCCLPDCLAHSCSPRVWPAPPSARQRRAVRRATRTRWPTRVAIDACCAPLIALSSNSSASPRSSLARSRSLCLLCARSSSRTFACRAPPPSSWALSRSLTKSCHKCQSPTSSLCAHRYRCALRPITS